MKSLIIMAVAIALAGCASTRPPGQVDPLLVPIEKKVPVPVPCPDRRGPMPDLPITQEKLDQLGDDVFSLAKAYKAAVILLLGRVAEDDLQIKSCQAPPPADSTP